MFDRAFLLSKFRETLAGAPRKLLIEPASSDIDRPEKNFLKYLSNICDLPGSKLEMNKPYRSFFNEGLSNPPGELEMVLFNVSEKNMVVQETLFEDNQPKPEEHEAFRETLEDISNVLPMTRGESFSIKGDGFLTPHKSITQFSDVYVVPWMTSKVDAHDIVRAFEKKEGRSSHKGTVDEMNNPSVELISLFHMDIEGFNRAIQILDVYNFFYQLLEGSGLKKNERVNAAGFLTVTSGLPENDKRHFYMATGNKLGGKLQNRILRGFDEEMSQFASTNGYGVLRYVDDFFFTSENVIEGEFMMEAVKRCSQYFPVNLRKLRYEEKRETHMNLHALGYELGANKVNKKLQRDAFEKAINGTNIIVNDLSG